MIILKSTFYCELINECKTSSLLDATQAIQWVLSLLLSLKFVYLPFFQYLKQQFCGRTEKILFVHLPRDLNSPLYCLAVLGSNIFSIHFKFHWLHFLSWIVIRSPRNPVYTFFFWKLCMNPRNTCELGLSK